MKESPVPEGVGSAARVLSLREPSIGSYLGHCRSLLDIFARETFRFQIYVGILYRTQSERGGGGLSVTARR